MTEGSLWQLEILRYAFRGRIGIKPMDNIGQCRVGALAKKLLWGGREQAIMSLNT